MLAQIAEIVYMSAISSVVFAGALLFFRVVASYIP